MDHKVHLLQWRWMNRLLPHACQTLYAYLAPLSDFRFSMGVRKLVAQATLQGRDADCPDNVRLCAISGMS